MTLGAAERKALEAGSEYFPYFCMEGTFDDRETRKRLEPDGITTSPLRDYVDRLLDFATRARWGKRPISRVDAFADGRVPASAQSRLLARPASDPETLEQSRPEGWPPHPGGRPLAEVAPSAGPTG